MEDAKKLARQADEIAQVINEDFDAFRQRVAKVRAKIVFDTQQHHASVTLGEPITDLDI